MNFHPLNANGAALVRPEFKHDDRGTFSVPVPIGAFGEWIGDTSARIQVSRFTSKQGVLRGPHFYKGVEQWRLLECLTGSFFVAIICVEHDTPGYGNIVTVGLEPGPLLLIPPGHAPGILALEHSTAQYLTNCGHEPDKNVSLNPFDKDLNIPWPFTPKVLASEMRTPFKEARHRD